MMMMCYFLTGLPMRLLASARARVVLLLADGDGDAASGDEEWSSADGAQADEEADEKADEAHAGWASLWASSGSAGSRGHDLQEYHMSFLQRRSVHKDSGALQQPLSLHCAQQSSFG